MMRRLGREISGVVMCSDTEILVREKRVLLLVVILRVIYI